MRFDDGRPKHLAAGQRAFFARRPDFKKAEECFRKATKAPPHNGNGYDWVGEAYHWLAGALAQQGRLAEACEASAEAIERLPSDPRPMIFMARYLHDLHKDTEALPWIEKGLALKPHYGEPATRLLLAEIYESLGRVDDAVRQWMHVKEMPSEYPDYRHPGAAAKRKLAEYARLERQRKNRISH